MSLVSFHLGTVPKSLYFITLTFYKNDQLFLEKVLPFGFLCFFLMMRLRLNAFGGDVPFSVHPTRSRAVFSSHDW